MIESDGPGGAEMMVFRLSEELRRRGHVVVPVGPRKGTGWLGELYRNANFETETYWLKRAVDPSGVTRLAEIMRRHQVDVVHSHDFTMAVYGLAAARRVGRPHLITMHGGVNVCAVWRRRAALRWTMRRSAYTAMVSRATAQRFSFELTVPEDRFTVVPNGVPVRTGNAENVRAEFGVMPNETIILAVGNLEKHKGHRVLLEALDLLRARGLATPWRLIIAGGRGGPEHESLVSYIRDHHMNDRVHIATGRADIPDLLALADIYAMPSIVEGLPMALLEAMVAGKAIVASKTAGIPEAIVDGREGLLAAPGDVETLAAALQTLLVDPARRAELAARAAERSHREFTLEVMTDRYEALYRKAIEEHGT
jgi:glycosyltransferase involved in cell wall biosynthesis